MTNPKRRTGKPESAQSNRRHVRLQVAHNPKIGRYVAAIVSETSFVHLALLLVVLWLLFAAGLYFAERGAEGAQISSIGDALYWGIAAFSTAGIADTPVSGLSKAIGGAWIVIGSIIFFGTIVATVTGYFMRPIQRPVQQIVETIEYNLEHLEDLSLEELNLLKATTDTLIGYVEQIKERHEGKARMGTR